MRFRSIIFLHFGIFCFQPANVVSVVPASDLRSIEKESPKNYFNLFDLIVCSFCSLMNGRTRANREQSHIKYSLISTIFCRPQLYLLVIVADCTSRAQQRRIVARTKQNEEKRKHKRFMIYLRSDRVSFQFSSLAIVIVAMPFNG